MCDDPLVGFVSQTSPEEQVCQDSACVDPACAVGDVSCLDDDTLRQCDEVEGIAVHSMKDVPAVSAPGLSIVAMPPRASPFDALVSDRFGSLSELPLGSRVGTGALSRLPLRVRARN